MSSALVLGGGVAGLAAAAALAEHADQVTVLESDRFPEETQPRRGVPQARQNHMLMGGGVQALDTLLPGVAGDLLQRGAHRLKLGQLLTLSAEGWFRTHDGDPFLLACSRALVDDVLRRRVLGRDRIDLVESAKVVGLVGDAARVRGVRVEREGGREETLAADLVVDCTGSRSKAPQWLARLGIPLVHEEFVDPGLSYSGRSLAAPADLSGDFPGILIQTEPGTGRPGRGAAVVPQEDGRWIVCLMGTRGANPPADEDGFAAFARSLRHPIVTELLARTQPLGPIRSAHALANRRRAFDKLPLPEGFLALGDAVMVLSPNYATGMSNAALGALALRDRLARNGFGPGLGRRVQAAVAAVDKFPWTLATGSDRFFPGLETNVKALRGSGRQQQQFASRLLRTALQDEALAKATHAVSALTGSPASMMTPRAMWTLARGPRLAPLSDEQAIAQFPVVAELLARGLPALAGSEHGTTAEPRR